MVTKEMISDFLAQRTLALAGVSRSGKGFGCMVWKELKARNYRVLPVHPEMPSIGGDSCHPNVLKLPEAVGGVVIVVPPRETEKLVADVAQAGISRVWMQQGSESAAAIRYCREHGIQAVHGHCILMFLDGAAFFHRFHYWIWRMLGKVPS